MLFAQIDWQGIAALVTAVAVALGGWIIKMKVTGANIANRTRTDTWDELGEVIKEERQGRENDKKQYDARLLEKRQENERMEKRLEKLEEQLVRCHKDIRVWRDQAEKDRTENVQLRRKLTKNQARMIGLLHGAKSFLLVAEVSGKILYAGPEAVVVLKYLPTELEGQHISVIIPERYRKEVTHVFNQLRSGSDSDIRTLSELHRVDSFLLTRDGVEVPATLAAFWARTEYGDFVMFADVSLAGGREEKKIAEILDPGHTDEGPMKGLETLPP